MTVSTTTAQITYIGDGSTTFFQFGFDIPDESTVVKVTVDTINVSGFTIQSDGILFDVAPGSGSAIRIWRETGIDQTTNWFPFEKFESDKTEDAVDKLIWLKQEADFLGDVNLSVTVAIDSLTVNCDKGSDALIGMWDVDGVAAGVFSGDSIQDTAGGIPLDQASTDTPEGFWWMQWDDVTA